MNVLIYLLFMVLGGGVAYWFLAESDSPLEDPDTEKLWKGLVTVFGVIMGAAVAGGFIFLAKVYVDYLWFKDLGYVWVWLTRMFIRWPVAIAIFVLAWLWLRISLRISYRRLNYRPDLDWRWHSVLVGMSLIAGIWLSSYWYTYMLGFYGGSFGISDPVYGLDWSFYAFRVPMIFSAVNAIGTLVLFAIIVSIAVIFVVKGGDDFDDFFKREGSAVVQILTGHLAVIALIFAVRNWLARYTILEGTAGYVDVNIRTVGYTVMTVVFALMAIIWMYISFSKWEGLPKKQNRGMALVAASMGGTAVIWLLASVITPFLIQRIQVNPSEADYELPYIEFQIEANRSGYFPNLQQEMFPYDSEYELGLSASDEELLSKARATDWVQMLALLPRVESDILAEFADVDYGMYDGELVMLSAREVDPDNISQGGSSWVRKHQVYSHGAGLYVASTSAVNAEGEPVFLDTIGESSVVSLTVPQIYFGEHLDEYVFVNTTQAVYEFDDVEPSVYEGIGGIGMSGAFKRFVVAMALNDHQVLFTGTFTPQTRLLLHRSFEDRVTRIMNHFKCDSDPYAVASGNMWMMWDCYTTSAGLPFVETFDGTSSWMRNSLKVVMNSYTGEVHFYVVGNDPILNAWRSIYPGAFLPISEMPEHLRAHVRYPEDLVTVQGEMLLKYHVTNPLTLYNRDDMWRRTTEQTDVEGQSEPMPARFQCLRLPGMEDCEMVITMQFAPFGRQTLSGIVVGRMNGELFLWTMPGGIDGPETAANNITQHEEISTRVSLWNQGGSTLRWGNVIVMPVINDQDSEGTVVYVRPIYLESTDKYAIPQLKMVVISTPEGIVYDANLQLALGQLFGKAPVQNAVVRNAVTGEVSDNLIIMILNADDALKSGDLSAFADQWIVIVEEAGK